MARGGRKTPPPPNRTPIVTRSRSQDNIPPQTTTTSTEDPQITVEPTTPNPTGGDTQESFRQSLIKSHKAFASLRQPHRPWSQPLDFSEVREQLGYIDPTVNPTDSNTNLCCRRIWDTSFSSSFITSLISFLFRGRFLFGRRQSTFTSSYAHYPNG
jgi:hypothetical protein